MRSLQRALQRADFLPVLATCVGELLAEPADQRAGRRIGVGMLAGVGTHVVLIGG